MKLNLSSHELMPYKGEVTSLKHTRASVSEGKNSPGIVCEVPEVLLKEDLSAEATFVRRGNESCKRGRKSHSRQKEQRAPNHGMGNYLFYLRNKIGVINNALSKGENSRGSRFIMAKK